MSGGSAKADETEGKSAAELVGVCLCCRPVCAFTRQNTSDASRRRVRPPPAHRHARGRTHAYARTQTHENTHNGRAAMAQKTQEEDKEGIARMQRMVHESEEIGVATNIKLKMQTEQLKTIGVDVATVQARMKDANKLLNQMGRRMATDKFLMFFVGPSPVAICRACKEDFGACVRAYVRACVCGARERVACWVHHGSSHDHVWCEA